MQQILTKLENPKSKAFCLNIHIYAFLSKFYFAYCVRRTEQMPGRQKSGGLHDALSRSTDECTINVLNHYDATGLRVKNE